MDRTERFYRIQRLLEQRRHVSRDALIEDLGVSRATLKRDLAYLRDRMMVPIEWDRERGYFLDEVVKPLFMVLTALMVGAAVARSKKPERFLIPIGVAIWILGYLAISRVARTSLSLANLADPSMREFFSALGMHANDLGRLYAVAYALLLFTWAESKDRMMRLACLASMGVVVIALVFTFSRGAFAGFGAKPDPDHRQREGPIPAQPGRQLP